MATAQLLAARVASSALAGPLHRPSLSRDLPSPFLSGTRLSTSQTCAQKHSASRRPVAAVQEEKPDLQDLKKQLRVPQTPEGYAQGRGWFGFGPRQERWVGRLAMVGFTSGLVMEVLTGKGVLGQLGIDAVQVRYPFLGGLFFLFVAGLVGGYTVIKNPPDFEKAPVMDGAGLPRDPLKTFEKGPDAYPTYTSGGKDEPYKSDLK